MHGCNVRARRIRRVSALLVIALAVGLIAPAASFAGFNSHDIGRYTLGGRKLGTIKTGPDTSHEVNFSLAADSKYLYVASRTDNWVMVRTVKGTAKWIFGSKGTQRGQFQQPVGIAVRRGVIYVLDKGNYRVQKFSRTGTYLGQFGKKGTTRSTFRYLRDIAVDSKGYVYVVDGNRIKKFTSSGRYIRSWGSKGTKAGQFRYGASRITIDADDRVFVSDAAVLSDDDGVVTAPGRILRFTRTGKYVKTWTGIATPNKRFGSPSLDLAADAYGRIYIEDFYQGVVHRYTRTGRYLGSIKGADPFGAPWSITISRTNKWLYVLGLSAG